MNLKRRGKLSLHFYPTMMHDPVLVTFDSMKYPNSGFFSFGKSLGDALLDSNEDEFDLSFYVHKRASYKFDGKVKLVLLSKLHKIFFPLKRRYKLVHFTDQYCRLKPQKASGKRILTIHDINPIHEKRKSEKKIAKHINKLKGYIAVCDRIVTISHFVANDILTYFPEAEKKIRVIYNGADELTVPDGHIPAYVPKSKFLFTIGFVAPKKNFHVLPALLQGNDLELVISGIETPYISTIMAEAEKYGCQNRVRITGTITEQDKAWYYKNCEAFVFPSLAEGFGLPVIEAMHFGKPVFLSTLTSLPEIGGNAAFYFDSFEPVAMQGVFVQGMRDYHEKELSAGIIQHARQFDWEKTAQQYLALYKECLSE